MALSRKSMVELFTGLLKSLTRLLSIRAARVGDGRLALQTMRLLALFGVFVATIAVLTVAWRMAMEPLGTNSLLPLTIGVLTAFSIQAFVWNRLWEFPNSHENLLRVGFPVGATLVTLPV